MGWVRGQGKAQADAPLGECFAAVRAVERYPEWHPEVVRRLEVTDTDADGAAASVKAYLSVKLALVRIGAEFDLSISDQPPRLVLLTEEGEFEAKWQLAEENGGTAVELAVAINLTGPAPGGVGDRVAQGFVDALVKAAESQ